MCDFIFNIPELHILIYKMVLLLLVLFNLRNVSSIRRENVRGNIFEIVHYFPTLRTSNIIVLQIYVIYANA